VCGSLSLHSQIRVTLLIPNVYQSVPSAWYTTKSEDSLAAFLRATDVLLVALPSTPATRHILNARRLSYLQPSSVLINIGRGDLVDTAALLHALDSGALAGAALDVTEPEPLPAGHPLFGRPNVIVTPHLSGRTERYYDRAVDIIVENLERWRTGRSLVNVVDRERGY
jgi:phosphoglycerate dehydrogenase-like enzyme